MEKIRIVLADDHAVLREGLAALINAQDDMQVIAHAQDGASALQQVGAWAPDVVVMDLSMPGISGVEPGHAMVEIRSPVQIVVLTRHTEPGYLRQMLRAGASGYVLKQSVATELLQAIRTVAAGNTYLDPSLSSAIAQQLGEQATQRSGEARSDLSERETDVVRLLAHGYSNKEIATQLGVSGKTVDTYKIRAMDKLGLHQGWFATEN